MVKNYIFRFLIIWIWVWVILNINYSDIGMDYIQIFYSGLICILSLYICGGRMFCLSPMILRFSESGKFLEYRTENEGSKVGMIYVRPLCSIGIWYELDYALCIPKNCTRRTYDDFILENRTCGELLHYMYKRLRDKGTKYDYRYTAHNYRLLYIFMFLLTISILLFIWFGLNNI